jgi:hypothetical protein
MKVSALLCVSVAVFAVSSLGHDARAAVPSAASQKAPSSYRLGSDPAAEKACEDKGGVVTTDQDGIKTCTLRVCAAAAGASTTTKLDANDPNAAKKCQDACGVVSKDDAGALVCKKPGGG